MASQLIRVARSAMGSVFEIYLGGEDAALLEQAGYAALERVGWLENQLSHYLPDSDICRINAHAFHQAAPVTPNLFRLLLRLRQLSMETEGAFDCTAGRLVRAWGFFRQGLKRGETVTPPDAETLAALTRQIGWRNVELNESEQTIRFLKPEVELHLGAVGKGYIVQTTADYLRAEGVNCALLQSGQSSIVAISAPPESDGWRIGIPDPRDEATTLAVVSLRDAALSTSGSAEQFVLADGARIAHLLDPRTGCPIDSGVSVSVLSADATEGDALSTAFAVQGSDWARDWCARHPDMGAIFLRDDGTVSGEIEITRVGRTGEG